MTIIHLIRHGQAQRVAGDPGLTETGREQARRTALSLQSADLAAVYASPLNRAQETAAIVAATFDLKVATDPRLRERANWGDDPAQPLETFLAMWGPRQPRAWTGPRRSAIRPGPPEPACTPFSGTWWRAIPARLWLRWPTTASSVIGSSTTSPPPTSAPCTPNGWPSATTCYAIAP